MRASTRIKRGLNTVLEPFNLRLETLTAERHEAARIAVLARAGYFERPAFPLPAQFDRLDLGPLCSAYEHWRDRLLELRRPGGNDVGYDPDNAYFRAPDAEVLYLMAQIHRPRRWIEVGSGNSTRLLRQAIIDGDLQTEVTAIDPDPRTDVAAWVDRLHRCRFEEIDDLDLFDGLAKDDVLFIDSSHLVRPGSDVTRLFLSVLPRLRKGVIVHVHDVFLPYDYPRDWVDIGWGFNEQYLLQALLADERLEVLWPGHHLQRNRPELVERLPFMRDGPAQSFWLRL